MIDVAISKAGLAPVLGAQVRRLRKQRGWSQQQLADLADVAMLTVHRIEDGQRVPDAALLFTLADLFEVDADVFRQLSEKSAVPA